MSSRTGRRIHFALLVVWTLVGIPVSYLLRESVSWLNFLCVYAIIVGHASGWSSERPTEIEELPPPQP